MASGNAGKGRRHGSRNKLTQQILDMVGDGVTPVSYCLGILRNEEKPADLRLTAARIIAPYVHPRPAPDAPTVRFDLPQDLSTAQAVREAHVALIRATSNGDIPVALAKDISTLFETQRRVIETVSLEERIIKLEQRGTA